MSPQPAAKKERKPRVMVALSDEVAADLDKVGKGITDAIKTATNGTVVELSRAQVIGSLAKSALDQQANGAAAE